MAKLTKYQIAVLKKGIKLIDKVLKLSQEAVLMLPMDIRQPIFDSDTLALQKETIERYMYENR